jgi:hypothetical protein
MGRRWVQVSVAIQFFIQAVQSNILLGSYILPCIILALYGLTTWVRGILFIQNTLCFGKLTFSYRRERGGDAKSSENHLKGFLKMTIRFIYYTIFLRYSIIMDLGERSLKEVCFALELQDLS